MVFILLLFFIVTTTFTRETQLRVDLPQAVTGTPDVDVSAKQLDIAINADGIFSLNNQLLPKNDLATLIEALQRESGAIPACRCRSAPTARPRTSRSSRPWMRRASWASVICA